MMAEFQRNKKYHHHMETEERLCHSQPEADCGRAFKLYRVTAYS